MSAVGSTEWTRSVSASKAAAILGMSPYDSPLSMWRKIKGLDQDDHTDSPAKRRGRLLESALLQWWREEHPGHTDWVEQPLHVRDDLPRCLSHPDASATLDGDVVLVEAKTAARSDGWGETGTDEIPGHYYAQAVFQLLMCPAAVRVDVVRLGPFLEIDAWRVERDDAVLAHVEDVVRDFVASLDGDVPPPLSDHPADLDAVMAGAPPVQQRTEVEVPEHIADRYLRDLAHEARIPATKAALIDAMGAGHYATSGGVRIARRTAKGLTRMAALPDLTQGES